MGEGSIAKQEGPHGKRKSSHFIQAVLPTGLRLTWLRIEVLFVWTCTFMWLASASGTTRSLVLPGIYCIIYILIWFIDGQVARSLNTFIGVHMARYLERNVN